MSALDERMALFLAEALPYRLLQVAVSRADERRLDRYIEAVSRELGEEHGQVTDDDLAIALMAAASRGLDESESEDGVWSDTAGRCAPLPRPVRSPWWRRLKFARQAAVRAWRST